ncbi:ephrin type-A receptor 3-like [Ruditapes philippinarum]|uniref:ephrin type-A receptor 3-like n=1 Tax=Ruditapes philippinarum TaxID=129788 RepID=UPI00295B4F1C|nr:ephrin type-A receptor 3-like [Ruditapes philippinarum]
MATKKTLKCPTPTIDIDDKDRNVSYGFWLDGFMANKNVTDSLGSVLEGERLNDACHDSDVSITLGDKNCAILSRHDDVITCDPGESFPGTARSVTVKVKIGNIEVVWGTLKINSFWTNTEFIYIAVGAGVFLIIIIAFIVCVIKCRRKDNSDSPGDSIPLEIGATGKTEPSNYTTLNPIAVIQPQYTEIHTKTSKEIADDFCKRLLQHVGKVVNSSIIERSNIDPGKICTHKEEGDLPEWLNTGLLECTMLQDFDNDNVLQIKGIAIDTKNIYIIYPALANKTLKDYLISEPLNVEKKLEICIRVCEGMNYLSSQSIVHRDLAARNCWVSRDFEVKISDASFSYDLYPDEYFHSNGRYQPVRWMAPESLRQGFYDAKSDVWSYGVVIWEVFANGYLPYYDITDNAMIKSKVCDEHYRLGKPVDCDDAVFQIICDCQKDKSEDRPNFFIIQNMFDHILNPGASLVQKANQQELVGHKTGRETYENLRIVPPSRPPKGHRP